MSGTLAGDFAAVRISGVSVIARSGVRKAGVDCMTITCEGSIRSMMRNRPGGPGAVLCQTSSPRPTWQG